MFYYLFEYINEHFAPPGFDMFKFLSFRSALAAITGLFLSLYLGPKIINYLRRQQIGETIKEEGPQTHKSKAGTPTMGGIIIILAVILPVLFWADIKSTYILLVLLGTIWLSFVGFVDDYLNNLTIGAAMRGITDQHKVPREMTAMAINVTGAPVCVLLPFSTWAAFIYGLMLEVGVAEGGLISEYTKLIPFIFFAIVMVGMVPFMALGIIPRFGPIKKAYERVEKTGKTFPEDLADTMGIEFAETQARIKEKGEPKLYDFLIPIIAVIVLVITTEEIMYGLFLALALCFILYVPRKKMNIREFFDNFFEGAKEMLFIAIFVMMAFIFVEAVEELGLSEYVITSVEPYLNGALLPALAFVIVAVLAFFGIDFWGIMILMFPIVAPLAQASGVNVYLALGGVVSGAVFGGMACFFSEQMIMSSTSVQIRPTDQAVCLLPYALIACAATTILYLIFGFAL